MDFLSILGKANRKVDELSNNGVVGKLKEEIKLEKKVYKFLYKCDNILAILDLLEKGYEGEVDLIYVDPPFFTNKKFYSTSKILLEGEKFLIEHLDYDDAWDRGLEGYLEMLALRLILLKRLLSTRGSIYVHLDFRTVHYVKIIMDYIFGRDNFVNEIIWSYKSGGSSKRHFSKKHDTILFYSKTKDYIFNSIKEKSYNRGYKAYRFKNIKEYKDEKGWYTLVNPRDVWDIPMVGRTSKERLGYRTQKPEALIEKIILSSSNEESIVADFFAGSGTTLAVADKHNRRWIGCDNSNSSIYTIMKRIDRSNYKLIYEDNNHNRIITRENVREFDNTFEIELILDSYKLDVSTIKTKDRDVLNYVLEKNGLSLIDYISIGYTNEKDIIHREEHNLKGLLKKGDTKLFRLDKKESPIFISFLDIFGNMFRKQVNI